MKKQKFTLSKIKRISKQFQSCRTLSDLSSLMEVDSKQITLLAFSPLYYHFNIPKKNNKFRSIEAPEATLKEFQRKLNYYLQSIYYLNQSTAAHGYICKAVGVRKEKNIYTNALQHLSCTYMMNADFKDFFHQISLTAVKKIFSGELFNFDTYTAGVLSRICCYKDRLPMGSPTSPVLSNLYTIALDYELTKWATDKKGVYTRFVDDLSFSSLENKFYAQDFEEIQNISEKYKLHFNPDKTIFYHQNDIKKVTGLVLNETVDIDQSYYQELDKDLNRLKNVMEVQLLTGKTEGLAFLRTFKQELMGRIQFIANIEGKNSTEYLEYINKFYEAQEPDEALINRWTNFSNYS